MLLSYSIPIIFVYYKYNALGSRSISSIITSEEPLFAVTNWIHLATRDFIAACMFVMSIFTVLYEYQRQRWSLAAILILLIGIFGVIFIPEQDARHYIFAAAAFLAILGFMVGHTCHCHCHSQDGCTDIVRDLRDNLRILLYAQILFMVLTVIGVFHDTPIFTIEALYLLNFAVFYLYIHSYYYYN